MTVRDLIAGSLRLIGASATGETPSANEISEGFSALTSMMDSFSNEGLLIYSKIREQFNLVAGQQTYAMGPTGDWNTVRPQLIENALIVSQSSPVCELPMEIYNQDQFAMITVKSTQSTLPRYLYSDTAFPLTNVSVWPVPSTNIPIVLYSWKPLAQFATVNDIISLPPGYLRMLRYNLAIEIAPEYGASPSEAVLAIAVASKESVKRMNSKPIYLGMDQALIGRDAPFNWLTGDTV